MVRVFWREIGLGLALTALSAAAQAQDLEAGKSPSQLFSSSCVACHRGPQGLAKGRSAGALTGFLREHYTTGSRSAGALAGYLASAGGGEAKPARAGRESPKPPKEVPDARARTTARPAGEETPATRRSKREEREAARRAAAGNAGGDRPPGLDPRAARSTRVRRPGEPAVVGSDPDPVIVSTEPAPLVHQRALSRVQEARPPQAPATAEAPASAPGPASVAAVAPGAAPATVPVPAQGATPHAAKPAETPPAATASVAVQSGSPAAPPNGGSGEAPAGAAPPTAAEGSNAGLAVQPFSAPLP